MAKPRHDSEPNPRDTAVAGIAAVQDIDQRTQQETEALLSAVCCAAWPSLRAQNQ